MLDAKGKVSLQHHKECIQLYWCLYCTTEHLTHIPQTKTISLLLSPIKAKRLTKKSADSTHTPWHTIQYVWLNLALPPKPVLNGQHSQSHSQWPHHTCTHSTISTNFSWVLASPALVPLHERLWRCCHKTWLWSHCSAAAASLCHPWGTRTHCVWKKRKKSNADQSHRQAVRLSQLQGHSMWLPSGRHCQYPIQHPCVYQSICLFLLIVLVSQSVCTFVAYIAVCPSACMCWVFNLTSMCYNPSLCQEVISQKHATNTSTSNTSYQVLMLTSPHYAHGHIYSKSVLLKICKRVNQQKTA